VWSPSTESSPSTSRRLLEHSDLAVEEVAARSGFGTATTLREHFARAVHTTPTAYRRAFRAPAAP
jgi:AraC family transcriptional activator FtrA